MPRATGRIGVSVPPNTRHHIQSAVSDLQRAGPALFFNHGVHEGNMMLAAADRHARVPAIRQYRRRTASNDPSTGMNRVMDQREDHPADLGSLC